MSVRQLSSRDFASVIAEGKPVLVDFFAAWCGPCKLLAPVMEELVGEVSGKAIICKVDIDQETALAERYEVRSVPTIILFRNGKEANRLVGYHPKEDFLKLLG